MMQQFYPQTHHTFRYELNKDMQLSAAHFIPHENAGNCQYMHGHTYFINVTIAGDQLDKMGFLIDFKDIKNLIHKRYDHTVLNDHPEFKDKFPTTEFIAEQIWITIQEKLKTFSHQPKCIQVIVRETPTSYVVFRPKAEELL
ncbi:MAG: 6-carboxytetrahydropterin synthase QueD [Paenisporosarcina sp.]